MKRKRSRRGPTPETRVRLSGAARRRWATTGDRDELTPEVIEQARTNIESGGSSIGAEADRLKCSKGALSILLRFGSYEAYRRRDRTGK